MVGMLWFTPGLLLLIATLLFIVAFINILLTDQQLMGEFMSLGLLLGICWWLYTRLPASVRQAFRREERGSSRKRGSE